ncbi:S41 family peptidase [Bhargavaea cecembensis]|uniref:S41 family peptidase n=1 Tax=Bhargavaea cecembensis TaxID=394098 RepID=UPI00058B018D|nr:S41 family peptidase [Bhargavaea cecembensis]
MRKLQVAFILAMTLMIGVQPAAASQDVLTDIKFYVKNYYYGDIPLGIDDMKTIREVTNSLDEYSTYMTKAQYEAYLKTIHIPGMNETLAADTQLYASPAKVSSEFLFGNTARIQIESFQVETPQAVIREWQKMRKLGAKQLILDFRFNGGGTVASAESIIGMFQNAPKAYTRFERDKTIHVKSRPSDFKFPEQPYLLVNKYSASASELVSAAVKDQKAGVLVGQKTFGKGSVQSFFDLSDGGALKLTIAHFAGPGGTKIQGLGINPDHVTPPGKEIEFAHEALARRELATWDYLEFPDAETKPGIQPITIRFSQDMNFSAPSASNRVELIRLGTGNPVTTTVETGEDGRSLRITPERPLERNAKYVLAVHPRFADGQGIYMRKGAYLFIKTTE